MVNLLGVEAKLNAALLITFNEAYQGSPHTQNDFLIFQPHDGHHNVFKEHAFKNDPQTS